MTTTICKTARFAATATAFVAATASLPSTAAVAENSACTRTATTVTCSEGDYWMKLDLGARTLEAIKEPGKTREVHHYVRVLGKDVYRLDATAPGRYVRYLISWTPTTAGVNATTQACPDQGAVLSVTGSFETGAVNVKRWDHKNHEQPDSDETVTPPADAASAVQSTVSDIIHLEFCHSV